VTENVRAMVTRWGMSPEVGLLALSGNEEGNFLEQSPVERDAPIQRGDRPGDRPGYQVHQGPNRYAKVLDLLRSNRERLDALAYPLLREKSLSEEQMRKATGLPKRPATESAMAANR
jgi:ATP-dependent Zn protease